MKKQKFEDESDEKELEMLDITESHNQTMSHLVSDSQISDSDMFVRFPQISQEFSFSQKTLTIREKFAQISKNQKFEVIENDYLQMTIIKSDLLSCKNIILKCVTFGCYSQPTICVRLKIQIDKVKCCKKVTLFALQGANTILLRALMQKLTHMVNQTKDHNQIKNIFTLDSAQNAYNNQGAFQEVFLKLNINKIQFFYKLTILENQDSLAISGNLESNSFIHFSKILQSTKYSLGQSWNLFLTKFVQNIQDCPKASCQMELQKVMDQVNITVDALFNDFNYAKQETKNMMSVCRLSVERYAFLKAFITIIIQIGDLLQTIYDEKYVDINDQLTKKQNYLKEKQVDKVFEAIGVSQEYQLNSDQHNYNNAINQLKKMHLLQTPSEKLHCLQLSYAYMKIQIIDYKGGQDDYLSMDDELPLTIFLVAMSYTPYFSSNLQIIQDYIDLYPQYDSECRIITNFQVSVQYIINDMKI